MTGKTKNKESRGQQTRREIVEKAAPLFNRKGFEGTSLSDLMEATGLQKGGIYRHFASKEELATEAFDYAWDRAVHGRLEGVAEVRNCVDRIAKMIENFVEVRAGLVAGGCPLMNTAVEADDGNVTLRARAKEALRSWMARIEAIAAEGLAKKEVRRGIQPRKLAQRIIASLEGALLITRLENDREALRDMQEALNDYLEKSVRA